MNICVHQQWSRWMSAGRYSACLLFRCILFLWRWKLNDIFLKWLMYKQKKKKEYEAEQRPSPLWAKNDQVHCSRAAALKRCEPKWQTAIIIFALTNICLLKSVKNKEITHCLWTSISILNQSIDISHYQPMPSHKKNHHRNNLPLMLLLYVVFVVII